MKIPFRFVCSLCIFFFLLAGLSFSGYSSHNMGGELTWRCVGDKYIFKVTFFRNCTGIAYDVSSYFITAENVPPIAGFTNNEIPLHLVSIYDASPQCNGPGISCGPTRNVGSSGPNGAIERFEFESDPVTLPAVTPPAEGFTFSFAPECCRDGSMNIGCSSMMLRAKMFQYITPGNFVPRKIDKCYDSAPAFSEAPNAILYASTTDTFIFNNNAIDYDLDSLSYSFDYPWNGFEDTCTYTSPFTVKYPYYGLLPDQPNSATGEISFIPGTIGSYNNCIRVDSWRCGQLISSIFRDFKTQIIDDAGSYNNVKPFLNKPFDNGTAFDTTITAGDTILFRICGQDKKDDGTLSTQQVDVLFNGIQFGKDYKDVNSGCPSPPCAILNSSQDFLGIPPFAITNYGDTIGYGYSGVGNACAWFYWPTSCDNIKQFDCGLVGNIFNFVLTVKDDYCDVPGKVINTVSIRVLPPAPLYSPDIHCVNVIDSNTVRLDWNFPAGSQKEFVSYEVLASNSSVGPYAAIANLTNINQLSYTDTDAKLNSGLPKYYYVRTVNKCFGPDTLGIVSVMRLNAQYVNPKKVNLSWNPIRNPRLPSASPWYKIYRKVSGAPSWSLLDSSLVPTYTDTSEHCGMRFIYKVEQEDALGCASVSTLDSVCIKGFGIDVAATRVCPDKPTDFTCILTGEGGNPPFTFNWSGDDGFTSTVQNPSYTFPSGANKYGYTLTVQDALGCTIVFKDTAIVSDIQVGFTADTICPGKKTTFKPLLLGGVPPFSFNWSGDDGFASTDSIAEYEFPSGTGSYSVFLTVLDAIGCVGFFNGTAVVQEPLVDITSDVVCKGNPTTITPVISGGKPPFTYNWTGDGGFASNSANPQYTFPDTGLYKVYVTFTDSLGCTATDSAWVRVSESLTVAFNKDTVCEGVPMTLNSSVSGGQTPYTYAWSADSAGSSNAVNPTFNFPKAGVYTVNLSVTDLKGCAGFYSTTVHVAPQPQVTFETDTLCTYKPFILKPAILTGTPPFKYQWTGDQGFSSTDSLPVVVYSSQGQENITLTLTDANNCTATYSSSMQITSTPLIDFFANKACRGTQTIFNSSISGGTPPYAYTWSSNGNMSSSDADPVHTFPSSQLIYDVMLAVNDANGCDTSIIKQIELAICDDYTSYLYVPNAFTVNGDGLNEQFVMYHQHIEEFNLYVFNRWGERIYHTNDIDQTWKGTDEQGNLYPEGVYVYMINARGYDQQEISLTGTVSLIK